MKIADDGADFVSAPTDYASLFATYYPYVVSLVRRLGIYEDSVEDVASEILLRLYERDVLSMFNPHLVFNFGGEERPARFKSFLSTMVVTYVQGFRDKQRRLATREPLVCDMPITVPGAHCTDVKTWIELNSDTSVTVEDEVLDQVAEAQLVAYLREQLSLVPRRSPIDTCDLPALFDAVVTQVRRDGRWSVTELKDMFGVSATAMHSWMWWLRANIATILQRPCPPKRPRIMRESHQS